MGTGQPYFTVELDRDSKPVRVVATGEMDTATTEEMSRRLGEAHEVGAGISLDLGGVTFIDSSGLRVIAAELHRSQETGQPFVISAASARVRRIFAMTGLDSLLPPSDPVEQ